MSIIDELRKTKIMKMAVFDWVLVIIAAMIITWYMNPVNMISTFLIIFVALVILGIITHKILGIPTMFGYYLGLNEKLN